MALRLRRGLDIERQSITFAEGEPLYTTDTKQLYVGDGSTVGGNLVTGITKLLEDPTPQLGNNLDLNNYNITGVGNIDIVGDLTLKGGLQADFILADYRGSLFGNDSTMLVDGNQGVITASVVSGDVPLVDVDNKRINLHFTPIESLENVHADMPMTGDILIYNTDDGWVASSFGTDPITKLPPPDHSLLQYSVGSGWIGSSQIISGDSTVLIDVETGEVHLGGSSIKTFGDVFIDEASLQPNEVLTWDGDFWTHKEIDVSHINLTGIVLDNVSNVNIPAPSVKEVLQYDGTQWVNGSVALANLEDVWIDPTVPIKNGQRLEWDGHHWVPVNNGIRNLDDTFIQNNPILGSILTWDGSYWIPSTPTDVLLPEGGTAIDIVGYDSTLIVDASSNSIYANEVTCNTSFTEYAKITGGLECVSTELGELTATVVGHEDNSILYLGRKFSTTTPTDETRLSVIKFATSDTTDSYTTHAQVDGRKGYLWISSSDASNFTDTVNTSHLYLDGRNGCVGIGKRSASYKLDVEGEVVSSSYVQFGSLTSVERDALTAVNGMVIYNTTNNKFEGHQNGAWINLDDGTPAI